MKFCGLHIFFCIFLLPLHLLQAQTQTNCENSNFYNDFNNWKGYYGTFNNPFEYSGFVRTPPIRHLILREPVSGDPNTGGALIPIYQGDEFSARLGNDNNGAQAEVLTYDVNVSSQSYLFVYRYAVVLEDPSHQVEDQPSFTIEIQDTAGNVLDSTCGYYYVFAQPGLPGWRTFYPGSGPPIHWRDWTTVGMNLSAYDGETVTIVFITRDCALGAHFGYAYLSTFCSALELQVALCQNDTVAILTAPPGFTYLWSTGETGYSITIPNPITGSIYSCIITAYNGCQDTIYTTLYYTEVDAGFSFTPGCQSSPIFFTDTSTINQNTIVNRIWDFNDGTPPVLTDSDTISHMFGVPGSYQVKLKAFSTDGCMDSAIRIVSVDSLPLLSNDPLTKQICNITSTGITLTSNLQGTLFTWSAIPGSPNIEGYSDQTSPTTILDQTLTNTGQDIEIVAYHIQPQQGSCLGNDTTFVVSVVPQPDLINTILDKTICDSTYTNVNLQASNDSTASTWTCTAFSPNLFGYEENITSPDTLINQLIQNNGDYQDTVIYHLVPTLFGCQGDTTDFRIIVQPEPDLINFPLEKEICDSSFTDLVLQSTAEGTLFTWLAEGSSHFISGYSSNTTAPATEINQFLTNQGLTSQSVLYRIIPHSGECTGDTTNYTVYCLPWPSLSNFPLRETLCSMASTNLMLMTAVTGTSFTWNCSQVSGNVSGWSVNTDPTDLIDQTLVNHSYVTDSVVYHIIPEINGCQGTVTDYTFVVHPVPDLSNTPPFSRICSGDATEITLTSNVPSTDFTWNCVQLSGNITGWSPNPGPGSTIIDQKLFLAGIFEDSVEYLVIPHYSGCLGQLSPFTVFVAPFPVVMFESCFDTITTIQAQPIALKGAIPLGGTYFGTGVSGSTFYPIAAGLGTHLITYTYANSLGCTDSASRSIFIPDLPSHLCGDTLTDPRDNKKYSTVLIGSQCWMATNLNYGSEIPYTTPQRDNCIPERYRNPGSSTQDPTSVYQWNEVMQYQDTQGCQGLCPPGWHIPSEIEWGILFSQFGNSGFAGNPLKLGGYSGFNALTTGIMFQSGTWRFSAGDQVLRSILFWSSTPHSPYKAWAHALNVVVENADYTPSVSFYPALSIHAFAVRCLKD